MRTLRSLSLTLVITLLFGFTSTEALAARHYHDGSSSGGTTTSTLSDRDVRNLAKAYLADFQAIDPNITYRDLLRYIYSLNASSYAEAETALQAYLASLQPTTTVNQPPTISGSPATSVTVGSSYSFTPAASDADGDALSFSASNLPAWAGFNSATGAVSGTPAAGDAGVYGNIVVSVSDGTDSASLAPFSITVVNPVQLGGTIGLSATTASVTEGGAVNVTVTRSNSAGTASVAYGTHGVTAVSSTLSGNDYVGFDPITLNFAEGETSKVISVQTLDDNVAENTETFEIYLASPSTDYSLNSNSVLTVTIVDNDVVQNQAPTISGTPATSVTVGNSYGFTPAASDADGDALTFSVSNLPAWAGFNSATGALSGTPATGDAGVYGNIVVSVSDGTDSASLAPFSITVDNPVQLGGTVGFSTTSATVTEGGVVNVTVTRSNSAGTATVMYGTHGVTAVSSTLNGDDYAGFDPITLNFAEGETSKVVSVQTLDNTVAESTETFEIYLASPSTDYTLDSNSVATVSILDNDTVQLGSTTLSWTAPSTRADGETLPLSEIDGYRIYMGDSASNLTPVLDINDSSVTQYTLDGLAVGTHYFSVTTYDVNGMESSYSNIVSKSAL